MWEILSLSLSLSLSDNTWEILDWEEIQIVVNDFVFNETTRTF
ncbi:MAG: hypothetical protein N7Q72_05400 [Spiroplasma sp. Tabriz.8]|nr:hypothetical protein [Spiroplasma sp. Tabriz.8]